MCSHKVEKITVTATDSNAVYSNTSLQIFHQKELRLIVLYIYKDWNPESQRIDGLRVHHRIFSVLNV